MNAPELELLTSGDARVAEAAVAELEGLRADWSAFAPPALAGRKLRVVAFSSDAEYGPFRVNAFSPAYFMVGSEQDTIVLGRLAKQNFPALRHEFVHHLLRARWRHLPLWLEEGVADYYGGVDGGVTAARADRLRQGGLLPLTELALVRKCSARYQERDAALQFYAQSWALVHLLVTAPAYRAEVWAYVERMNAGEGMERAVERAFGRSMLQFEADLAEHLGHLTATAVASRPSTPGAVAAMAGTGEVALALARLLLRKGDTSGAQRYLDLIPESSLDNPELRSLTEELALKHGRSADARSALRDALGQASRDSRCEGKPVVFE